MPKRGQLPDEPPRFFCEISLGGKVAAKLLRDLGWDTIDWFSVFPSPTDADLRDEVWIPHVVGLGMCILTTDDRMRYSDVIRTTIANNEAHVFASTNASLSAREQSERFHKFQDSIYRKTTLRGPVYCTVSSQGVSRKWWRD